MLLGANMPRRKIRLRQLGMRSAVRMHLPHLGLVAYPTGRALGLAYVVVVLLVAAMGTAGVEHAVGVDTQIYWLNRPPDPTSTAHMPCSQPSLAHPPLPRRWHR